MNGGTINDLRQFIVAAVSQATAGMATKEDIADLATKDDIRELDTKIDDLDLKVDTIADALHEHLTDHEVRIAKLERQLA